MDKTLPLRAELRTVVGGLVGIIEATTLTKLRKEITREWLPILCPGDIITVSENER